MSSETLPIWIGGEIVYIPNTQQAKKKIVRKLRKEIMQDVLGWNLAYLLNHGMIRMYNENREDITYQALKAITNTLKLFGLTWKDVEILAKNKC